MQNRRILQQLQKLPLIVWIRNATLQGYKTLNYKLITLTLLQILFKLLLLLLYINLAKYHSNHYYF